MKQTVQQDLSFSSSGELSSASGSWIDEAISLSARCLFANGQAVIILTQIPVINARADLFGSRISTPCTHILDTCSIAVSPTD